MKENFLHFLWQFRRFDRTDLQTTQGQPISIMQVGQLNTHSGPDFFNSRLSIGDTEWAGNVEMHVQASEWYKHNHQNDAAYDNVILHVVFENDMPILRKNGTEIPCLVLNGRIPPILQRKYEQLLYEKHWVPCAERIQEVPNFLRLNWFDRILVERLEEKTALLHQIFERSERHWGEALYCIMARSFGLRQNVEPFEALARSLPFSVLGKHGDNLFQVEALLFGQAGFLDDVPKDDDYRLNLAKEYQFLKHKYQLKSLHISQWKFLRMRPANFPTVRLAQFAALVCNRAIHPDKISTLGNLKEMENLLKIEVSPYWQEHYIFGKKSKKGKKPLGKTFLHLLAINTLVPFLFLYGKIRQQPDFCDRALALLEQLPAESNSALDEWAALGCKAENAGQSQALLQLKPKYCDARRCLECAIGHALLK